MKQRSPTFVTPPPFSVPMLIVTPSRNWQSLPITRRTNRPYFPPPAPKSTTLRGASLLI